MRINESFPLRFYGLEAQTQVLVEVLSHFKEKAAAFAKKKQPFSRIRKDGSGYESLKTRQFLINMINKLIEVIIY